MILKPGGQNGATGLDWRKIGLSCSVRFAQNPVFGLSVLFDCRISINSESITVEAAWRIVFGNRGSVAKGLQLFGVFAAGTAALPG